MPEPQKTLELNVCINPNEFSYRSFLKNGNYSYLKILDKFE
jgi:hypothetical protein